MVAAIVFAFTYLAFVVGRVPGLRSDRVAAAVVGASAMVVSRASTFEQAQAAVDGATIALLFGMMVLSGALEISGTFGMVGRFIRRRATTPRALLLMVSVASALLSAFLINDVVCIAFTPLVVGVAEAMGCDPKPHLVALATS